MLVDAGSRALLDEVLAELPGPPPVVGALDDAPGRASRAPTCSRAPADAPAAAPADLAHLLFTSGLHRRAQGRDDHPRQGARVRRLGAAPLRREAPATGSRGTRRCTSTCRRSTSTRRSPRAPSCTWSRPSLGIDPRGTAAFIRDRALTQWFSVPSVLTYLARFDAVAQDDFPALERLLWCGEVLPTPVLAHWMRRLPARAVHQPLRPHRGHDRVELLRRARGPRRRDRAGADRTGVRRRGAAASSTRRWPRCPRARSASSTSAASGSRPGYWRDQEKTAAAFRADPRRGRAALPHRRPGARRRSTASCTSSGAPTRRSRAAATASSSARSRPRWPPSPASGSAPWSASTPAASRARRSAAPTRSREGHELPPTELRTRRRRARAALHGARAVGRARRPAPQREREDRPPGAAGALHPRRAAATGGR